MSSFPHGSTPVEWMAGIQPCLPACLYSDVLLSLRGAAKRRRSNLLSSKGIASLPTVARNDKTARGSNFRIDTRLDSGLRTSAPVSRLGGC